MFVGFACRPVQWPTGKGPLEVADTLYFDTLVALVDHPYQHMVVRNLGSEAVHIQRIRLSGGLASPFRINVDGYPISEIKDYRVDGNDSFWVFAEIKETYVPTLPIEAITDSIEFWVGTHKYTTILRGVVVSAVLIEDSVLACHTQWKSNTSILLGGDVIVSPGCQLTIEEGATIFAKPRARLIVYGALRINGSPSRQVRFTGTRLDNMHGPAYPAKHQPGQWEGIFIVNPSGVVRLQNTIIENGTIGLYAADVAAPSLWMDNVIIRRHSGVGLWAKRSRIEAYDVVLQQACGSLMVLDSGGDYQWYHTTAINMGCGWCSRRQTASLQLSNRGGNDLSFRFVNGIVWGEHEDEIKVVQSGGGQWDVVFEYSAIRDSMDGFSTVQVWNHPPELVDFCGETPMPDSGSFVMDRGRVLAQPSAQYDVTGKWRGDGKPDLGAYER